VQLAGGNRPDAIQTLKTAITRDPGSLAAERAKDLLRELGGAYSPPVDPAPLASFLTTRFGKALVPPFLPPDKMIDIQFSVRGADFSYGRELDGVVTLVNKSPEPLVITENSLFQGNIRISARVAGDVKQEIPNLISEPIRTSLIVDPGKNLTHTFRLSTGELRDILLTYAQAALQVQFTLYLDPVATDKGTISNRLVDVKPVTASITRPRIEVTPDFAQSRINIITAGQESQKAQTALLFTGLLKEQSAMAERGNLYVWQYADWLTNQLRTSLMSPSGLLLGGGDSEWAVKVNTMADMVSLPLDQDLAAVVLKNLNHSQWPVRLMAVYVLGKGVPNSVGNVLDWVIKNDKDVLVRRMATSLQASLATPPQR
jgi:hypothetical protein